MDGKVYYPKPGQLIVMPCNVRQSYETIGDNPFHKYWCHFTARIGERDLFEMYRFPVCVDILEPTEVREAFDLLIHALNASSLASILNARAAMLKLIGLFLENGVHQTNIPSSSTRKMSQVLHYIEEHLEEKMTVDHLAALVHYHPNYFIRAFHSVLGCSPIQYINRLRMNKARQLLATELSIGDIARSVGIEQHNFSTMFKSYTGFSPRDFRRYYLQPNP